MPKQQYRLTVTGCALSWFLLGMHVPALHRITHHGGTPTPGVLAAVALVSLAGVATLWLLLRARSTR